MDTYLSLHGNLVADPVQRTTASGASVVGFRVASSGRKFDKASGEFRDGDTNYMSVSCWRGLGGNVLATLRKGDGVVVLGRLVYRTYEDKQGVRRSVHEVDAIAVGPDLARVAADLRRPQRSVETTSGDVGPGDSAPAATPVTVPAAAAEDREPAVAA